MPSFALVTPYLPAPDNTGGRIRMHRLARALSALGPVDLFACVHPVETAASAGDTRPALALYRQTHLRPRDVGCVLPLITSARVRAACPWRLRRDLLRAHANAPYSAVIACHAYAFATARSVRGAALVLDEHNVESRYCRAVYPHLRRESALLARWETRAWRACDLVSTVTDDDAAFVRARTDREVYLCPNGADFDGIPFVAPSQRSGHDVLFVGAMSHPPNVQAAVELVREVLPALQRAHPDATVTLCGRAPSPEVLALASPSVTVTGTVDDVRPLLARASVYVNLVRAGAGSSLKVPEALCAGVPMVATETAVRGFGLRDGAHLRITETPAQTADAVLDTWRDQRSADARAERARELARAYDWSSLGTAWASRVMRAVESPRSDS